MNGWPVYDIAADVRLLVVSGMPALAPPLEAEIDFLWAAAQRRMQGRLFNGRVFSADTIEPHRIAGHWTEFRRIVAQMDRPELYDALRVRPLAVGGVIVGPDGVVLGRLGGSYLRHDGPEHVLCFAPTRSARSLECAPGSYQR